MLDELVLAERLISYDTSRPEEIVAAAGFVKGWLESRDIEVHHHDHNGLPVLVAEVGPGEAGAIPCVVFHGHLDVVPGRPEQFHPRVEGDRLIGRGAYDMKGGLASMMCALKDLERQGQVRVRLVCVPDEESEEIEDRSTDAVVARGLGGDFAITGEPTNLHIGVEAKGVLAMVIEVHGRAAHSSTPWLGDNAVLKAIDVFRAIESLPFSRESSEVFDRPSINLGRIEGGDAINKVPDSADVGRHSLPAGAGPGRDPRANRADPVDRRHPDLHLPAGQRPRGNPYVRALRDAVARSIPDKEVLSVGRDGASDAVAFMAAGIPAVEFGPDGAGHHGPEEYVSVSSMARYRRSLVGFVRALPIWLERPAADERSVDAPMSGAGRHAAARRSTGGSV